MTVASEHNQMILTNVLSGERRAQLKAMSVETDRFWSGSAGARRWRLEIAVALCLALHGSVFISLLLSCISIPIHIFLFIHQYTYICTCVCMCKNLSKFRSNARVVYSTRAYYVLFLPLFKPRSQMRWQRHKTNWKQQFFEYTLKSGCCKHIIRGWTDQS